MTRVKDETQRLRELFNLLNDGIIVMDKERIIVFINPAATRITGWELSDVIPYCAYCQQRSVAPGEQRCFLASQPNQSYFESELPTKQGDLVPVGMSRTFLSSTSDPHRRDMVITVRDVTIERQAKELALRTQLSQRMLEAQEEERKRLSQELHDGISQTLYGISLRLDHVMSQVPDQSAYLQEIQRQVQLCATEVRTMSRSLYPAVLYDLGLTAAIRSLADQVATPDRKVTTQIDANWHPDERSKGVAHVYRIVQEALHNAILHGKAKHIEISLLCAYDCEVTVVDDGIGFHPPSLVDANGYGLRNMNERARALQGTLVIQSAPEAGTRVSVRFPRSALRALSLEGKE